MSEDHDSPTRPTADREGFRRWPRTSMALSAWVKHFGPPPGSPFTVAMTLRPGPLGRVIVEIRSARHRGAATFTCDYAERLDPIARANHIVRIFEAAWGELRSELSGALHGCPVRIPRPRAEELD